MPRGRGGTETPTLIQRQDRLSNLGYIGALGNLLSVGFGVGLGNRNAREEGQWLRGPTTTGSSI